VWRKQNKPAVAYQFAKRCVELFPNDATALCNLGMVADQLYRFDEAETCFQRAINRAESDRERAAAWMNWACMLVNKGDWANAETMGRKALKYNPESAKAKANLGMACLALGQWREGWPLYDAVIGFDQSRRKNQYKDEPVWDGSEGRRVVIYGEQGLGDEICFASMLPDAIKACRSVVLDCTDRLAPLFQRSFPTAKVYGTRWEKGLGWNRADTEIDASISIGALGKFYRNTDAEFPGKPYLVPDPDRVAMWKGLFAQQGKPVIGIAWTGGVPWTADRFRRLTLEQLLPLFRAVDATWISLQYKDASREIREFKRSYPEIDIRQYSYGTLTDDYDDTAALVAALDLTIAPPTSVVHLAGAIGAPCIAMCAPIQCWKFASGLKFHAVTLIQHEIDGWDGTIIEAAKVVGARFA
jgi:tetratricopeptide (TPR) repeat protein